MSRPAVFRRAAPLHGALGHLIHMCAGRFDPQESLGEAHE